MRGQRLALQCASHFGDIALAGSHRLRMLAAAPILFTHVVLEVAKRKGSTTIQAELLKAHTLGSGGKPNLPPISSKRVLGDSDVLLCHEAKEVECGEVIGARRGRGSAV